MFRQKTIAVLLIVVLAAGCAGPAEENPDSEFVSSEPEPESSNVNTGEIVLSLGDISDSYDFVSESIDERSELDQDREEDWEDRGLLKQHRKTFALGEEASEDLPNIIISSAAVYETSEDAEQSSPTNVLDQTDASFSQVELPSGYTATKATNQANTRTMLYLQDDNIVIWLTASGESIQQNSVTNLFIEMVASL